MNSFTLLYLFYSAKLSSQASIYFIWLKDSSSKTIAFIAAAVAVFAIVPFFHVIIYVFSAKPFSNSTFIAYLCFSFLLAILWYKPIQDGEQRVLPFALVTTVDLLALFIFLFKKQIGHWHDILTLDVEQGHLKAGNIDDASTTLVDRGNEQVEHRNFGARPETPQSEIHQTQMMQGLGYDIDAINGSRRNANSSISIETLRLNPRSAVDQFGGPAAGSRGFGQRLEGDGRLASVEIAMRGPSNVAWGSGMVQPGSEGQEMEEGRADLELGQQDQRSGFFINLGGDVDDDFGFKNIRPAPVGHPALQPTFNVTSQPVSPDGFQTPKQAPSPTETNVLELNRI